MTIRNLLLTLCVMLVSATGFAQSSINKVVESLENDKNAQEIMYTEQRDPRTHKIIKSSRLIQISNEKILNKLIAAFKKDREKAVSYTSSVNPNKSIYSIRFEERRGYTAKYDLFQENGNRWMLSISIINRQNYKLDNLGTSHISTSEPGSDFCGLATVESYDSFGCHIDDPSDAKIAYEPDDTDSSDCGQTVIIYSSSSSSSSPSKITHSKSTSKSRSKSRSNSTSHFSYRD